VASFELDFVQWLSRRAKARSGLIVGIGDDMAVIDVGGRRVLMASDMMLDGVHFDSTKQDLRLIGRKALACNLSDCAAMAVRPVAATVSLAMPTALGLAQAQGIIEGVEQLAAEFDVALAGGDTTTWDQPLVIDVAIIAEPWQGIDPILRSGAKVGDGLYVTGPLGGSLLGRHLAFVPRVREARCIAEGLGPRLHAMMDISDGLSLDAHRLATASGVGVRLDEAAVTAVISDDARSMAGIDGRSPLEHALADGEDFELLLAIAGEATVPGVALRRVGEITASGLEMMGIDGVARPLTPQGYIH
jgi:thiamine-monophosphate kinase